MLLSLQTILFTTNDEILTAIAQNDDFLAGGEDLRALGARLDVLSVEPSSSTGPASPAPSPLTDSSIQRPFTGTASLASSNSEGDLPGSAEAAAEPEPPGAEQPEEAPEEEDWALEDSCVRGKRECGGRHDGTVFHMELVANWGLADAIGLTGVQFLGRDGEPLQQPQCSVQSSVEESADQVKR